MGPGRIAELRNSVSDIRHDIAKLEDRIVHDYATNEDVTDFLYEKVKRLQDEIDTLHKDNRRHGEEIAQLKKAYTRNHSAIYIANKKLSASGNVWIA